MVYPALLPLKRTPRLPVVDWTEAPADLNGLVRFVERWNLVSARVPSHFKRSLPFACHDKHWLFFLKSINSSLFKVRTNSVLRNTGTTFWNVMQTNLMFQLVKWPTGVCPTLFNTVCESSLGFSIRVKNAVSYWISFPYELSALGLKHTNIIKKGKSVPLHAWSDPEGSRKLRFPDFMTRAQEGGKVVSLTHLLHLPPGNPPGTHFC
jgi:hypothetical protein